MESVDATSVKPKRETSADDEKASFRISNIKADAASSTTSSPSPLPRAVKSSRSSSASADGNQSASSNMNVKLETNDEDGYIAPKKEAARPSKSGRSASSKNPPRIAPLYDDLPDATEEANRAYTVIESCSYQNKYLGYTEHAMECDCSEEWGQSKLVILYYFDVLTFYRFCYKDQLCLWRRF